MKLPKNYLFLEESEAISSKRPKLTKIVDAICKSEAPIMRALV